VLDLITPLILTYNEAPNIGRVLDSLPWAKRIVVVDSFSTDTTLDILRAYPQVDVFQRVFDSFAQQCNYGLSQIESEWVLSLDADYVVTSGLNHEIAALETSPNSHGYSVRFKYCVGGQPLRGTLLPPRKVLYRRTSAVYRDDGHAHQVDIAGAIGSLTGYIHHDDRKSLSRWLWAQDRYMIIEAKKLRETPTHALSWGDKIRKQKVLAPWIILVYCLVLKGGLLDGWRGWYYAFQRMFAELLLALRLIELECIPSPPAPKP
jgi:glycosyltransferase involved in cell wall biosynthesis